MNIVESVQYGDYLLCLIGRFLLNFAFCLIVCNFCVANHAQPAVWCGKSKGIIRSASHLIWIQVPCFHYSSSFSGKEVIESS